MLRRDPGIYAVTHAPMPPVAHTPNARTQYALWPCSFQHFEDRLQRRRHLRHREYPRRPRRPGHHRLPSSQ